MTDRITHKQQSFRKKKKHFNRTDSGSLHSTNKACKLFKIVGSMTTTATTAFSIVPKFQEENEIIFCSVFWNLRKQKKKVKPHRLTKIFKNFLRKPFRFIRLVIYRRILSSMVCLSASEIISKDFWPFLLSIRSCQKPLRKVWSYENKTKTLYLHSTF